MRSPIARAPAPTDPAPATGAVRKQTYDEAEKIRDALKRLFKRAKSIGARFPEKHYGYHVSGSRKLPFGTLLIYTRPNVAGVAYSAAGWLVCPEARQLVQNIC